MSRTSRVRKPSVARPAPSMAYGPGLMRPRLGLSPTRPHALAGDTDRAAAVAALRDGNDACGDGGSSAARRAARRAREVPRCAGGRLLVGLRVAG